MLNRYRIPVALAAAAWCIAASAQQLMFVLPSPSTANDRDPGGS
jgi:hypothetical protein